MSPITSHVLDTTLGQPARALAIELHALDDAGVWHSVAQRKTDNSGRVTDLLAAGALERRTYRLTFDTGAYFASLGQPAFYPRVEVIFHVEAPSEHYHVPVLLSPFGYSTYRGT